MVYSNSVQVCAADSEIAPIANSTETSETLTTEEMAALFAGSKCTYTYEVWNDDKSALEPEQTGIVTPVIRYLKSSSSISNNNIFIYLPIAGLQNKLVYSFSCIFELPITIKKCDSIITGVAPSAYSSVNSTSYTYNLSLDMEYQLDSISKTVITNQKYYAPESYNYTRPIELSNGFFVFGFAGSDTFYRAVGSSISPQAGKSGITLSGFSQDVGSFGFVWSAGARATQTGTDNSTQGLGFLIQNFKINYEVGGGYDPNGGGESGGGALGGVF